MARTTPGANGFRARAFSYFLATTKSSFWVFWVDMYPALVAACIPWSTTAVAVFMLLWLIVFIPTIEPISFLRSLGHPPSFLPVLLFVLAVFGTFWADGPWIVRLHGLSPVTKLLAIPLLFYHFERSTRGKQVLAAFLASCIVLQVFSWIVALDPRLAFRAAPLEDYYGVVAYGVPVKNYIDQSQEFTLCVVALAYPILKFLRERKNWLAAFLIVACLSFILNMAFVIVSRTAMVTIPIMAAVFAFLHLKGRSVFIMLCLMAGLGGFVLMTSVQLRWKAETILMDYNLYKDRNAATSVGMRLEFWRKSLHFFSAAPFFGHGTGSIGQLFEIAAVHRSDASAQVVSNPHNQTLNVAIQWGIIGVVVLYAMWLQHLLLFGRDGWVSWIGVTVVMQNMLTSLLNSHLFDFSEGWIYVLGVGVAGGMYSARLRVRTVSQHALTI